MALQTVNFESGQREESSQKLLRQKALAGIPSQVGVQTRSSRL